MCHRHVPTRGMVVVVGGGRALEKTVPWPLGGGGGVIPLPSGPGTVLTDRIYRVESWMSMA